MRTRPPTLLPIFRSRGQVRLLTRIFVTKAADMPLTRLAAEIGMAQSRVHAEANRLEFAGLVRSRRVGNVRILEANPDSPYQPEFETLLLKAFGPVAILEETLRRVQGIEFAYIFGSWASRYEGVEGVAPGDLDVLVVGTPNVAAIRRAARAAARDLGRDVNPVIVTPDEWRRAESGFLRTLKERALVPLSLEQE